MYIPAILVLGLFVGPQKPAPRPDIKLVAVGQISKIEKAKRSFQLKTVRDSNDRGDVPDDDGFADIRIGVEVGRGTNATGPFPTAPNDPRSFPAGDSPLGSERSDSKSFPKVTVTTDVFLTDATSCKDGDKIILCEDLKATDNVRVTGDERHESRGKGLYATEVVRTR